MKIFKHKHCILKWKCNISILKESQIIKSFHIFCALFCNMRIGNIKKGNAFLTIPYVSKWDFILWWQVSYIHEIITQTKMSEIKEIAKCVTFIISRKEGTKNCKFVCIFIVWTIEDVLYKSTVLHNAYEWMWWISYLIEYQYMGLLQIFTSLAFIFRSTN